MTNTHKSVEEIVEDDSNRLYIRTTKNPDGELITGKEVTAFFTQFAQQQVQEAVEGARMMARQEVQIKQEIGQLGYQVIVATLVDSMIETERLKPLMAEALRNALSTLQSKRLEKEI